MESTLLKAGIAIRKHSAFFYKDGVLIIATVFFLVQVFFPTMLHAQQNQAKILFFDHDKVNFSTGIPNVTALPASINYQGQRTENGYYDPNNNNMVVYVKDRSVFNKNGVFVGTINNTPVSLSYCSPWYTWDLGTEVSIVPVPLSCNRYYLIYYSYQLCNSGFGLDPVPVLSYSIYDQTVGPNGGLVAVDVQIDPTTPTVMNQISAFGGFAVSKLRPNNTMFLYSVNGGFFSAATGHVNKYLISSAGITTVSAPMISFASYSEVNNVEVDLSPNGSMLAWGNGSSSSTNKDVTVVYLDANGDWTGNLWQPSINSVAQFSGIEFSPDNSKLYVGALNPSNGQSIGIYKLEPITQIVSTTIVNGTLSYGKSQLETSYDPIGDYKILAASSATNIGAITNPNSPAPGFTSNFITFSQPSLIQNTFYSTAGFLPIVFTMPDQVDGQDYSLLYTTYTQQCCLFSNIFSADNFTAAISTQFPSTTQTWTPTNNPFCNTCGGVISIRNKLTIPAGFNITISGMTFKFAPRTYANNNVNAPVAGANVVVMRAPSSTSTTNGGKLTLNNSTFTSYEDCGPGMWEGVDVEGWANVAQGTSSNSRQGWLTILNSSVISNAWHGVSVASVTNPLANVIPTIVNGSGGGVIKATLSSFRNNYMSVFFSPYDYPSSSIDNNASYFTRCNFETNTALHDYYYTVNPTDGPIAQVFLLAVKGLMFQGNVFSTNLSSSPYTIPDNNTGMGIWSLNSSYSVLPTGGGIRNKFLNLNYGIAAGNIISNRTISVDQTDFKNNYRGIYISGVNYATITRSVFEVYKWPYSITNEAYGIYTNYCHGFKIEENDFTYTPPSMLASSFGIIVNQSNPSRVCNQYDQIYRNTFHSIAVGIQPQGNNSEAPLICGGDINYDGLVLKCNKLYNNIDVHDFRVANFLNVSGNIGFNQGNCLTPAGPANNQFSNWCPTPTSDYSIDGSLATLSNPNRIAYTWSGDLNTTFPLLVPACVSPFMPSTGVNLNSYCNSYIYNAATSCPSSFVFQPSANQQRQQITFYQYKIDSISNILAEGNSATLYSTISSGNPGQIQNDLLAKSPYLSDQVLIAAINNNLPPGILKNIIVPNSPVSSDVMNALNTISLPNGIINDIYNVQTGVSARTQLNDLLNSYISQKSEGVSGLIRIFLNDSTLDFGVDSVVDVLRKYQIPEYKCEIVKGYFDKGDTLAARLLTDSIAQIDGMDDFCLFSNALLQLLSLGDKYFSLPTQPVLVNQVTQVSNGTQRTSADANALLQLVYHYEFNEYINPFVLSSARMADPATTMFSDLPTNGQLFPNPNNGHMMFSYNLPQEAIGILNLYDINGKQVDGIVLKQGQNIEQISEEHLDNGIYFFQYFVNNERINSGRIVIVK